MNQDMRGDVIETIRNHEAVRSLVNELCSTRTILQVHGKKDISRIYVSRAQEIHESGDILVSPFIPPDGEYHLQNAGDLVAGYALSDSRYEFDTRLVDIFADGRAAVRLSRPMALRKLQLRRYQRIRFEERSALPVSILRHGEGSPLLKGRIIDLGEGGMGSNVAAPDGLEIGMQVDRLLFALPDGFTVYTPATVRNVFPLRNTDGDVVCYRCGLQFEELEGRQRRALAAFIFKKQQDEIQRSTPIL